MICDDAAEYISALCDGETIPAPPRNILVPVQDCQARLSDYLAMGVELRRTASLGLADAVPPRVWTKPQNRIADVVAERMGNHENSKGCFCRFDRGHPGSCISSGRK